TAPPTTELYPLSYTTLFRSAAVARSGLHALHPRAAVPRAQQRLRAGAAHRHAVRRHLRRPVPAAPAEQPLSELTRTAGEPIEARSEEHTSELQSRENLVCRL